MLSDDNSVCDSVWAPGGCENFDASRTLPLIAANLGSKGLQSEVGQCRGKEIFEEAGMSVAGRGGRISWQWDWRA